MGEGMRVRIYLSYSDIKDSCKRRSDMHTDVEISAGDVQYLSFGELVTLLKAFPEYIPQLKAELENWEKGDNV